MARSEDKPAARAAGPLVTITRIIDALRDLVFRMWTQRELLQQWYAPRRCQLQILSFDFRIGGAFRHRIREPSGGGCLCSAVFEEIVVPERIVYSLFFCDDHGNPVPGKSQGADADWPDRTTVTVTFVEHEGRTTMTLHQTAPESLAKRTGAYPSWIEMLERMCEALFTKAGAP